jgi:hypothetical protein
MLSTISDLVAKSQQVMRPGALPLRVVGNCGKPEHPVARCVRTTKEYPWYSSHSGPRTENQF